MMLSTWLEAEKGRSAALAAHFGKTPAAISQWKKNGVPVDLMKAVRDFTSGGVTLEEMVPETTTAPAANPSGEHASAADWPRERLDRRERERRTRLDDRRSIPVPMADRRVRERREG
jgi:DNA-binding transcriptional regulator YdaS (Cro superfamily)